MATLTLLPAPLDLRVYRGDDVKLALTITQDGRAAVLPAGGWEAGIRSALYPKDGILATFTVDASEAMSGKLQLVLPAAAVLSLPAKNRWDLQHRADTVRTYLAGDLLIEEQVTP